MDRTTSVEVPAVHKQLAELHENNLRVMLSLILQPLLSFLLLHTESDRKLGGGDLGIKLGLLVS